MHWITGITLENYRAFAEAYPPITIKPGNHVLIYGENGSGKSSIYSGLRDFFSSSTDSTIQFERNLFKSKANVDQALVSLTIAELNAQNHIVNEQQFAFSNPVASSTHRVQLIQLANKVKGFIDYRRLLETHFQKTQAGKNPNLFNLVINNLLADHLVKRTTGAGVSDFPLSDEWQRIRNPIHDLDGRYKLHEAALAELPLFENNLKQLLIQVFTELRRMVATYFDSKLDIGVSLSAMSFERSTWRIRQELFLEIRYAGELIDSYHTFLNEARLSAIAICIYLAALKTQPLAASDLRVLFLDDVFIGLDTGNRIPLLNIIKKEFIDDGFQVFISTYDRHWFETARLWLEMEKCPFNAVELFVDQGATPVDPDSPVVVSPSLNELEKAKSYFAKKDYPAAANYLRKACEGKIKSILPESLLLKLKSNRREIVFVDELEELFTRFKDYANKNALDLAPFAQFNTYKKIIMNPLSHSDLKSPHYRGEIRAGLAIADELQKIKTKVVLELDAATPPIQITLRDNNDGSDYRYSLQLKESLSAIRQEPHPVKLAVTKCELTEVATGTIRDFDDIYAAYNAIWAERGYVLPVDYESLLKNSRKSNAHTFWTLMQF